MRGDEAAERHEMDEPTQYIRDDGSVINTTDEAARQRDTRYCIAGEAVRIAMAEAEMRAPRPTSILAVPNEINTVQKLLAFMQENDVPLTAEFGPAGYDMEYEGLELEWGAD